MDAIVRANRRLRMVLLVFTLLFLVIGGRIYYLTFLQPPFQAPARAEIIRGPIMDRRGLALAITEEASTIGISPQDIVDPEFTAEKLSAYLDMTPEDILQRFYINKNRKYFLLRRQLDNVTADRIVDLNLPGVRREAEYRRVYPAESLASNLLGFVGRDQSNALDGLERIFNQSLLTPEQAAPGKGPILALSLDSLIQYRLEKVLGRAFEESGSERAVGILMHIPTGEILALANFPNFDPNTYYRSSPFQRNNWAMRFNYEPGSTVKVFMAAMLLNENLVKEDERFFCSGEVHARHATVRCKSGTRTIRHGALTLEEIIERSCNVGTIKAMQKLKPPIFHRYLAELGLGRKTEVLPDGVGETEGYLPDIKNWLPSSGLYYPIGQGFSLTPLQLVRAGAAISGNGRLHRPILVREIRESGGRILQQAEARSVQLSYRPEVRKRVATMMAKVVQSGTGKKAYHKSISIIGKTGTGQKSSAQGYVEKYVVSFLGYFPGDQPEYVGLILFDEPQNNHAGGTLAAPVFRDFVAEILPIIQKGQAVRPMEKLAALQPRSPRAMRPGTVPDFRGLSASEALTASVKKELQIELKGSGFVFKQDPSPGSILKSGQKIILYLEYVE
ncbi:MAG: transpeptidase family protein [Spirochaetales bacterium]|nr:transpeptidase family protein [Spirochaetales bacterium]